MPTPTPTTPTQRPRYPHFARGDAEVWERWLAVNAQDLTEVYYDVALGGITINDDRIDQATRDGWHYTTAVKVDAVAVTATENLVCEVKPVARLGALGQALGYAILLNEEPLNDKPNVPTVIAETASADVIHVATALSVRLILTPRPSSPLNES